MTWATIARKDYRQTWDSKLVRYLVYVFVLVCLMGAYAFPVTNRGDVTGAAFAGFMTDAMTVFLPLIGLLLGYNAIVGERESGRLVLVLSQPHDRRDVVLGKFVGRGVYLVMAVAVGLAAAAFLVWYPFGDIDHLSYLAYALVTLCLGLVYFGVGLALSTLTAVKNRATLSTFGVFFVFVLLWEQLDELLLFGLERAGLADGSLPDWALFVHGAEPGLLYERIVQAFFEEDLTGPYLGADAPAYLGEWAALGLLLAWLVLPTTLGYLRFARADL